MTKDQARAVAEQRMKKVRLWKRKDSVVGTLSGGTKRRLSMVLSTIGDPRLLILDEVKTLMSALIVGYYGP